LQEFEAMKWHKSPDALVQAFDHCLPIVPGVQRKAMFGYPCAFLHGHLFCGLHQDGIIVRLPEARRNALLKKGASVFEATPGQAMKDYVVAPVGLVADRKKLRSLLAEALANASSLVPHPERSKTAKRKAATPRKKAAPAVKAAPKRAPARKVAVAKKKATRKASPTKTRRR
jgi:hypothetical protein